MGAYLIKDRNDPDDDFWILWSTTVDAPLGAGKLADLFQQSFMHTIDGPMVARAVLAGSSNLLGLGNWEHELLLVINVYQGQKHPFYQVKRSQLRSFVDALEREDFETVESILVPLPVDDEPVNASEGGVGDQ